jgi:hypothetical protein
MKPSKLLILLVVAVALLALAYRSSYRRHAAPPSGIGRTVLSGLNLDAVARVEIARNAQPRIVIQRGEDGWTVTNLFGYPADLAKLGNNLQTLAAMKVGDLQTDMNLDTNDITLVDLQAASGKPLATLRLGKHYQRPGEAAWNTSAGGRYLAVAGDSRVYLVKDTLNDFDGDAKDWVSSQLLNLSQSDIQTIELSSPTGQVFTLSRATGTLQAQGLSTNEELDVSKTYGIESAFGSLSFAGVANPALTDAQTGLASPSVFRVTLKNGDAYTARIGGAATNQTDRYVRLSATLAPPGTNATQKAEVAARQKENEQKFGKWTYLISSYTAENMTRTRAELVKPKVAATNETPAATSPAGR